MKNGTVVTSSCCGSNWKVILKRGLILQCQKYDIVCETCGQSSSLYVLGHVPANLEFSEKEEP